MEHAGTWYLQKGTILTILTISDAVNLSTILHMAQTNAFVRWVDSNYPDGIGSGTVRSVGDEHGNFLSADDDVRDAWVRVTTTNGFEMFTPIVDIVNMVRKNEFCEEQR